ncbi:MAG: SMP-30/gluconolactonase/LRE family protein [Sulfurifustaceae bacterium]
MKSATHRFHPLWFLSVVAVLVALTSFTHARERDIIVNADAAVEFARLPADLKFPEGIAANPANGDIYVATLNGGGANALLRYDRNGRLVARNDFSGPVPMLGLAFNPRDQKVYIASVDDFVGAAPGSRIRRIPANFDANTPVETVAVLPAIGAPSPRTVPNPDGSTDTITFGDNARVPNGLAFNSRGDLYISDSFQGAIFRIDQAHACTAPCAITTVVQDSLLATAGFPPFGANGLALNQDESALFIANTGDDRILRLNLGSGAIDVFSESINGADGVTFDAAGNLWVAANQADNIVALNPNGRVIAQLGAFLGIRSDGAPRGLLFPASIVVVGHDIFVTNLALPLGSSADEPESDVTTFTLARIAIPGQLRNNH